MAEQRKPGRVKMGCNRRYFQRMVTSQTSGGLRVIVRTLAFTLSETQTHWKVLSGITLVVMWRRD